MAHHVFRCTICSKVSPPGMSANRVVVETRSKKYPFRANANRVVRIEPSGKRKVVRIDDPGGIGSEIVREGLACSKCAGEVK